MSHLVVDLLPNLGPNFARVAREERQKALRPRVDHVDLVQRNHVNDLVSTCGHGMFFRHSVCLCLCFAVKKRCRING